MKEIKLSGREQAVLRAIGYGSGSTGTEIQGHTGIDKDDLVDILNGLFDAGYVEITPIAERVAWSTFDEAHFEINPAYALQLKEALRRN